MRAIALPVIFVLASLFAPLTLAAPPASKIYRVGYLLLSPLSDTPSPDRAAFIEGMRNLGYEEGRNLVIEYRSANWEPEFLSDLAAELVKLPVDVIIPITSEATRAAMQATRTIPIVMPFSGDPVGAGLVKSLAHPGGNVAGLTLDVTPEVGAKLLQLLKEAAPKIKHVTVLWNPTSTNFVRHVESMKSGAKGLGITLTSINQHGPKDIEAALAIMRHKRPDALIVMPDPATSSYRQIIAEFATANRIPTMFGFRLYVDAGGLMSYGPNLPDNFRRAATYVDKIFKGAKPADLPIEQPTKFELVINLKTAKALRIKIPPALLLRADEVIR
ncbi:MAG: ABC transporter substrate-binding protein [Pseudomonadota bacterium]